MATYNVNGIVFKQLSQMQNAVLWGLFKMNDTCSMAQLAQFVDRAKGTVIPHCRRLEEKGFIERVHSRWKTEGGWVEIKALQFKIKPWVKGEIRKAINRGFPFRKIVRESDGSRSYIL